MNADERKALVEAGLPRSYTTRKFESVEGGGQLKEWFKTHVDDIKLRGRCVYITAEDERTAQDAAYLMGRGLLIGEVGATFWTLPELADALKATNELWEDIYQCRVIVVPRFYDSNDAVCPLGAEAVYRMREFLLDWLADERALVVGCHGSTVANWWGNNLATRIMEGGVFTL